MVDWIAIEKILFAAFASVIIVEVIFYIAKKIWERI